MDAGTDHYRIVTLDGYRNVQDIGYGLRECTAAQVMVPIDHNCRYSSLQTAMDGMVSAWWYSLHCRDRAGMRCTATILTARIDIHVGLPTTVFQFRQNRQLSGVTNCYPEYTTTRHFDMTIKKIRGEGTAPPQRDTLPTLQPPRRI